MPIWLRRFTYQKIEEYYKKQKEAQEKQQNQQTPKQNKFGPDINPTYTTKTSGK